MKRCVIKGRVAFNLQLSFNVIFVNIFIEYEVLQEIDVKAGGGQSMTIGTMLRQWLVKLEWFSTLFPRIPVPIQQKIQAHLEVNSINEC